MENSSPRKQLWIILTIIFLGFLGISIPYLIFPALFINPEYSILPANWSESSHYLLLGVTLAAYPLGQFIGSPILGSLSDDYGRKSLLAGSLLCAAVCNLMTGLALEWQQLTLVILSRFAAGFMEGNIAIARAMAADIKSISKHETFGKINAVASIAFLVGPLLGGLLADDVFFSGLTNSTPFYLISFLFFCVSGLSLIMLKTRDPESNDLAIKAGRSVWARINIVNRLSVLFKNRRLRFLMIVSSFFTLAVDIFYEFGPVYLTAKWMIGPVELIAYNSILCLTLAIGNGFLASYTSMYYSSRKGIIASIAGFAIFLVGMIFTDTPLLMWSLFGLSGFVIGIGVTLITVKISDSVSDAIQGEVMGVQLSLRVLGDAVICLLGGIMLLISSKMIIVCAALISAGTLAYYMSQVNIDEKRT
ncbi:MAG: MFS transporter [Parachlamydiaceae bacterium]|nr:MFS transporter [Parachlamydiaceae bacterium]